MKTKDIASRRFWRRMPPRSTFYFLLTVFLIFAPVGFISDIWQGGKTAIGLVWLQVLYSGIVAIAMILMLKMAVTTIAPPNVGKVK